MVVIAWIIAVAFAFLVFMFRKKNAVNLKVKSKDRTMVQMTDRRRKALRLVWYFGFGLSLLMAIALSTPETTTASTSAAPQPATTEAPAVNAATQTIKPYPYEVASVQKSDFAGRRRSAVKVLVRGADADGYNTERLAETAREAAKNCGRVSQAYIVWLYDREIDVKDDVGVTVGIVNIGKWTGEEPNDEKIDIFSEENRNTNKEMNDKLRAERKSS